MQKIPLTVRGAELLKAELQHLKSVARPEVIEAIAEARSHGDLSENAEYEAAKERQGFIEGRIADVENKLSRAHIINPADIHAEGKVVFGATVTLEDLATEEEVCYQIVGEDEADIKQNKISIGSPIARALIAKPDIIFADEPTGNLDSKSGGEVMEMLQSIWKKMGKTLVIITHDRRIARMADRQFVIVDGVLSEVIAR